MTSDLEMARDEHTIAAIGVLLASGFDIHNGKTCIWRNVDDGRYYVSNGDPDDDSIKENAFRCDSFHDFRTAVAFYLDIVDGTIAHAH